MREALQKIVESTPGAVAAILMGFDGIAVDSFTADDAEEDIESTAMEFSFRFVELKNAAASLDLGEVADITLKAEHGTFLARCLTPEYFVGLLLRDARHFGKGRWMLRSMSQTLAADL